MTRCFAGADAITDAFHEGPSTASKQESAQKAHREQGAAASYGGCLHLDNKSTNKQETAAVSYFTCRILTLLLV